MKIYGKKGNILFYPTLTNEKQEGEEEEEDDDDDDDDVIKPFEISSRS